jgi:hypothetical protein
MELVHTLSIDEFRRIAGTWSGEMKVAADPDEILEDLLFGRVLTNVDGNLSFKSSHFYYYFLAKHFIEELEGPRGPEIRGYLEAMADRPLTKSNQLTLIFFLFFKKRDPVIDRIIKQANDTLADQPLSDMFSDTLFIDAASSSLKVATVDTQVDAGAEREKRLQRQDSMEADAEVAAEQGNLDLQYADDLDFKLRAQFATARLELLGQVIRNFPDSLDGEKKVEILETAFRLGLRLLHATLGMLEWYLLRAIAQIDQDESLSEEEKKQGKIFVRQIISLFARACCDGGLLSISRAVGVSDLERAYAESIERVGNLASTKLIDLAIKLDHSEGFPFKDVQQLKKSLPASGQVALAVLSDLIVRHTQVFKLRSETLRKIAGLIGVNAVSLYEPSNGS